MIIKHYLLMMLPLKVIVSQLSEMSSLLGYFNPSQIVNVIFLLSNIIFIIVYLKEIIDSRIMRSLFVWICLLIFVFSLQPVFSYVFTRKLYDWANFLKLINWVTVIPLAFIAFQKESDIKLLRYSAFCAFAIVAIGLIIGNIFKIGHTAYDFGIFHSGFFMDFTPVSMALATFLPFFFLPYGKNPEGRPISLFAVFLIVIDFVLILLIMKRSSILAFFICTSMILLLFGSNRFIRFSMKAFFVVSFVSILSLSLVFSYISVTKPELIERRFIDFKKYEDTGEMYHLGAGRVKLFSYYLQLYIDAPVVQKICGVDIFGRIDKNGGYLDTGYKLDPHNDYMDCLMRSGILGLTMYLGLFLCAFLRTWKVFKLSRNPLSVQLYAVMLGMFSVYLASSIAGMNSRVLAMTSFAMLLGVTLGIASRDTSLIGEAKH